MPALPTLLFLIILDNCNEEIRGKYFRDWPNCLQNSRRFYHLKIATYTVHVNLHVHV